MREARVALDREHVGPGRAAGSGVDADRQVEPLRLGIDGEEVGVVQRQVALDALDEHADRAVLFAPTHLLNRGIDRAQRRHQHPADAAVALV